MVHRTRSPSRHRSHETLSGTAIIHRIFPGYLIASLTATDQHYPAVVDVLAPQGKFGLIDDPNSLDARPLKQKAASLHWEFMLARSLFNTSDILEQHNLLNQVAELVETGVIRTTVDNEFGKINATNLRKAHALIESGRSRGKIVLAGF